jgi:hypothetical protein
MQVGRNLPCLIAIVSSPYWHDLPLTFHFSFLPVCQALASERPGACYSDCLMHCGFAQDINTGMAAAANF